jgi:hypothetical protein
MPSSNDPMIRALRFARRGLGVAAYSVGAVTGLPYGRLLGLRAAAERALAWGDLDEAETLAQQLLDLAERFREDWYYGNAIHHGHTVLGRIELARGNPAAAEVSLMNSGRTPGSPQLNSFGPTMALAEELLEMGRADAVLEYLELCRVFWCPEDRQGRGTEMSRELLEDWIARIQEGRIPDFGGNLVY